MAEAEIKEITDHAMRLTLSGTIRWWERKQVRPYRHRPRLIPRQVDKDVKITYHAIKETASLDVEHLLVDAPDFDDEAEPKYVVVEEVDRTQFVLVDAPPPADNLTAQQGPADDSETRTSHEAATERRCQGLR